MLRLQMFQQPLLRKRCEVLSIFPANSAAMLAPICPPINSLFLLPQLSSSELLSPCSIHPPRHLLVGGGGLARLIYSLHCNTLDVQKGTWYWGLGGGRI